jgi:putative DNA primase/helicase
VSLRAIVRVLGGDLYDGGRRANVPAPNHSAADRSVSLLLKGDRVVVHTFGGGDWRAVLDDLRDRRLIDDANVLMGRRGTGAAAPSPTQLERRAAALDIWACGRPLAKTPSERYCRSRAITRALPGPWALRHSSETAVSVYRPGRHRRPALLAGSRTSPAPSPPSR